MTRYTTVLTVFLSAILVLSAIGTVLPPAFANPGHELNITPLLTGQGLPRELTGVVDEVTPEIHIHRYMVVMDPDEDFAIANNPDTCLDVVAEPGDRIWELQDANGDRVGSVYQAHAAGEASTLVMDDAFGSGDFTNSIDDLTVPTMTFHDETGGTLDDHDLVAPDFQFQWRDGDGNPDDTETVSLYHLVACGFVDLNGDDVFQSGVDLPDVIVETFRVVAPHTTLTKDADSDKVVAGDVITYTVRETNDGFVPLNEPTVVDSLGVALARQPDDPGDNDNILEPGETWVYTGTYATAESDCGELINTVISSTTVAGSGFPAEDEVASTSVMVICPAIEITKTPDADKVISGTEVTYEYAVTNTGDVELTDISVDDDVYGHIGDIASLAPGATDSLFHTAAIDADVTNIATATGNHQLGTVSDSDDATVRSISPAISLTKTSSADKVLTGIEVTYEFEVCNDGNVALNNVNVDDDNLGHILGPISLEPGECAVGSASEVLNADKTNIATATGDHQLGTVSDEATVTVRVINPSIDIMKTPDQDKVVGGTEVTYEYKVTNTGDVELTNIDVSDDVYGPIGTIPSLAPGDMESLFHTAAVDIDTTNIATATGNHQLGTVTDSADAFVRAIHPDIVVEKTCDPLTQVEPGTIAYTILVTNTGDVDLFVSVDGSMFGNIFTGTMAAGETKQFDFTETDLPAGIYTNTVTVTGEHQLGTVTASASATCEVTPAEFEGLTPGFWKNNADRFGAGAWVNYSPDDSFEAIFGVDVTLNGPGRTTFTDPTLREALDATGGGVNALARHAVAALLNINNPDISYPISEAELIAAVQDAINSGDPTVIENLKNQLDEWNNLGADIDQHWTP